MKCKKCGAEISDKSKFCNECGEKVIIPVEEKPLFTDSESDIKEKSNTPSRFEEKPVESTEPKVKCQKCGAKVPESFTYCDKCGEKIVLPPKPQPLFKDNFEVSNNNTQVENKSQNKEKKIIKILAGSLAAVSVIAIISIAVALTGNKSVQPAVVPTTQHINDYDKTSKIESFTYKEVPTEKETMAESKTETKPQSKQESKTESKVESNTEYKSESKVEVESAVERTDTKETVNNNTSANGFWANGTGDYVASGLNVENYAVLHITYTGSRNFVVKLYKDDEYEDLLVNTIGDYTGDVLVEGSGNYSLEIKATDSWDITSDGLNIDDTTSFSGTGDSVTGITSHSGGNWHIKNNGERNFSVIQYGMSEGYMKLLVNKIGNYEGTVRVESGDNIFFKVHSYGDWSIEKE